MKIEQLIHDQFLLIPEQLQELVFNKTWEKKAQELGSQYDLTDLEKNTLSEQILLVLLALESRGDFLANLKRSIHISEDKLSLIAQKVDNDVFMPVREILDALDEVEETPGGVEVSSEDIGDDEEFVSESKEEMLHGIEEPESILPEVAPHNLPATTDKDDSLISGAMSHSTITPKENAPSQKMSTYKASDPYRESID